MNNKTVSNLGFIGISLLIFTLIFGGLLIKNYDITNQFISESYAIDTKYGVFLRLLGYIPSGIIIALFCFLGEKYLDSKLVVKIGFYGIGIFYGLGTTVTGIFPCDSGCNKELLNLSSSQIIHNIAALLMYLFVPFFYNINWFGNKKNKALVLYPICYKFNTCLFIWIRFVR